jgi:putative nucleotidyltransferase with HDIG domain
MEKILINELTPEMKIIKTDKPWIKIAFLPQNSTFEEKVKLLKNYGVKEVYVKSNKRGVQFKPITSSFEAKFSEFIVSHPEDMEFSVNYYPTVEEVVLLQEMHSEAKKRTKALLEDARIGNTVNTSAGMDIVESFVDSCFKKPTLVASLSRLKDFDDYTFTHSLNVSVLSISLGKRLGMNTDELRILGIGALFHDIGKMKVPEHILNKPGKFTDEEFEIMKQHPLLGFELLKNDKLLPESSKKCILEHHERADGSGYPNGLEEKNISKLGKITSIVDVYDAITSDRVYHKGMPAHDAIKLIFSWSGKHFNKVLVKFFVDIMGIYPTGTLVLLNSGELAIVYEINKNDPTRPLVLIISDSEKKKIEPFIFDLSKYNLVTQIYYKTIVSPIDPKPYNINPNEYIESFSKKAMGVLR